MNSNKTNAVLEGERFIELNGKVYFVKRSASIFTNRSGKMDVRISGRADWGSPLSDGYLYRTLATFTYESKVRIGYAEGVIPQDFPLDDIFTDDFYTIKDAA